MSVGCCIERRRGDCQNKSVIANAARDGIRPDKSIDYIITIAGADTIVARTAGDGIRATATDDGEPLGGRGLLAQVDEDAAIRRRGVDRLNGHDLRVGCVVEVRRRCGQDNRVGGPGAALDGIGAYKADEGVIA